MKKVLITASTFSHIVNFHLPYLTEFRRLGWEVHTACGGEPMDIPCADKAVGVPLTKSFFSPQNFRACAALRTMMKRERYDLIITHTSLAAFFTRLAEFSIKPHIKTVNVVHGYLFDDRTPALRGAVLKGAELLAAPQTDIILTMNDYDTRWARAHRAAGTVSRISGMGVDEKKLFSGTKKTELGFDRADFVLVYPAEFSKRKNQKMLISALARLPEKIRLVLPGDGALLESCKRHASELGVGHRVVFPGYVKDIGSLMLAADAAVSSSRSEGLPFNIVEAMLCSLPVVASRVKGNEDLVDDGVNGFLYDYDDIDGFTEAVETLYADRENARRMGEAGRKRAESYTLGRVLPQVMKNYIKAIEERK